ncbi:MAG TPA: ATP-binding protein [Candidatus Methylacidiphilales bacterium]|nr:ATP-binding protein [Candidatus Methylacidiphilales bacterium]
MEAPLGIGNFLDWSELTHHGSSFDQSETVEQVYGKMLAKGIDFAAAVDEENVPVGLVSFKMLAAALSARYGQALFAKRILRGTHVPSVVFGPIAAIQPNELAPLVIPISQTAVINPALDFFAAQAYLERRPSAHSFDDIIVTSETGTFEGLIPMRDFMKLQMDMLRWQESQLRQRNDDLNRTLSQLSHAQDDLVNSAKMAALGELVAGIAHEMNTPLGVLISSHDMIEKIFDLLMQQVTPERRAQLNHYLRTNIDLGREASERVTQIIRSLRTFGRNDHHEQHLASLADLITSTLVLLANKFKSSVTVHTDIVEAAHVRCYPGQISQVLVNVLTNAFQAMGGKGTIFIELQRGLSCWELTIRDTGPGIPPHLIQRIFDPGFTTKGVGVGTGLGLSISRKIIEQSHGGRITVFNHPEGGAVFRIEIPISSRETAEISPSALVSDFSSPMD